MFDFFSGMLLFVAAFIGMVVTYIIENIVAIIIAILMIIILWFCFSKWPKITVVLVLIVCIATWGYIAIPQYISENYFPVSIYGAEDICFVYSEDGNIVEIPAGSIIARYIDEKGSQHEGNHYYGQGNICCWYYNGIVTSFNVSYLHEDSENILEANQWKIREFSEITYKELNSTEWWKQFETEAEILAQTALENKNKSSAMYALLSTHPFEQQYWVIFTEGSRDDRVEVSTVNSPVNRERLCIIWDRELKLNDDNGQSVCNQYYLNNGEWETIGTYHLLSGYASNIIASNLDIYDNNGNLIFEKCAYSDIDWSLIYSYQK